MKLTTGFACFAAVVMALGVRGVAAQTPAPEPYAWRNVAMGGGGFVTGIIFHPTAKNLMYARTDVGGAYRWEDSAQKWIPITDWLGPNDNNLLGIESLALDPSDPQRVYLAAGTYSGGDAAILRSDDQGRTFKRTAVPFNMGGNEIGRFNGERLAVDPNDGDILFFGSRAAGLWQSGDRGATWQAVTGFPSVGSGQAPLAPLAATNARPRLSGGFGQRQAVGIVAVVFDPASGKPGGATPKIFAAVSTTETNLFVSADAGATWQAVANQPVGLRPIHAIRSPDGKLYLTYGREPGPNTMTGGAVWKYDPPANAWTEITPLKSPDAGRSFGYGAVAVDPQHPSTVMVTTFAHWNPHDLIFRSLDGGARWTQLWQNATKWDHSSAPYTQTRTPHWLGSIVINPHNSDQVLFTTGYGIWNCVNATKADSGEPTGWVFLDEGLEETVPLALISPPAGAHLISGVGDIDGFVHDDLNTSPAEGTFSGPRYGNTEDLAFAANDPLVMVRSGTAGDQDVRAAFSRDGGVNWKELETEPPTGDGAGAIAISADTRTIAWTPRGGEPYFTTNWGASWVACAGLSTGVRVIADAVNPQIFYAFDPASEMFCTSTNGGASFSAIAAALSRRENHGDGSRGMTVIATPGIEADVWLASRVEGLFHSTNGGASFTKLERVQAAGSLGLGKAAPGKTFPALFLAGRIGEQQALFRSDDAGESWVRINDDQHQYGHVSHVTGDPRIYGRVYFATGGRGVIYGDINQYPFQNPGLPLEERANNIVSLMTLDEKVAFFSSSPGVPRLGIGRMGHVEGLHGLARGGPSNWGRRNPVPTTIFPQAIGLAETWDPELLRQVAAVEGYEARYIFQSGKYAGRAGLIVRAPNADMGRDPRWGRTEECYGEDPFFNGTLVTAFVKGLQGDDPKYWLTASLLKHFFANSNEDGRERSSSDFDEALFREYYSVPFRRGFEDGGARCFMTSYNQWNHVPCTVQPVIRNVAMAEWGVDGIICTDGGAAANLTNSDRQHYYANATQAAVGEVTAGINQFLDNTSAAGIANALASHLLTEADLDRNLKGTLRVFLRLGLLDPATNNPYAGIGAAGEPEPWWSANHKSVARLATQKSIVLLKNAKNLLPLDRTKLKSVAVIGPRANEVLLDWYSGTPPYRISPVEGIRNKVGAGVLVNFATNDDRAGIVKLARASDVVILCVGNNPIGVPDGDWEKVSVPSEGREAVDRKTISLEQEELVKAVCAANPKTIVVLISSFPYAINWTQQHVPAIVHMTQNSQELGNALADVLFGDYNPAGRLVETWPQSLDQLPPMMDYNIRHGRTYMYFKGKPLYPFGFGLSYTTFKYSNLRTSSRVLAKDGSVVVSVDVKNTGSRAGEEVVQLYVRHQRSALEHPAQELRGFQRVALRPGQTKTVELPLAASSLAYWDVARHDFVVEPGKLELRVGGSSADIRLGAVLEIGSGAAAGALDFGRGEAGGASPEPR